MKFVQDDIPHVILSVSEEESFALAEKILHSTRSVQNDMEGLRSVQNDMEGATFRSE